VLHTVTQGEEGGDEKFWCYRSWCGGDEMKSE
jgi:hypothetical protein